jgi:hypothetical protein
MGEGAFRFAAADRFPAGWTVSRFSCACRVSPVHYSRGSRPSSAALHCVLLEERMLVCTCGEIQPLLFWLGVKREGFVPFRCGRPLSCGVDGEPLQLRLQGLTCPLFPRESTDLRCTALGYFG